MAKYLNEIYELTNDGAFVKVNLKDEREIECVADCYCEDDEEEGGYIPALLIVTREGEYEILVEKDIYRVE